VFAVAFTALFALRAALLGRWSGRRAQAELATCGVSMEPAPVTLLLRASLWVALDLWLWLWLLVLALHLEPWLVAVFLPLMSVRAGLSPSWLTVVNGSRAPSGVLALWAAIQHAEGLRGRAIVCELLLTFGAMGLAFNFGALLALIVSVGQDALGLDLAFVRAFLSPRNHFALLALAALSLALLEPVRASLATVLYVDTELTRGGADLRALVQRALASKARLVVLLCACCWPSARVGAQEAVRAEPICDEACMQARAADDALNARARKLLRAPEFAEFPDETWMTDGMGRGRVESWLDRLLRWLEKQLEGEEKGTAQPGKRWELPGIGFFIGLTLALVAFLLALSLRSRHRRPKLAGPKAAPENPLERAAALHFADALALFGKDSRAALRSLYIGTLVGLSERKLLALAPERTNGQYLRQLAREPEQAWFAQLTRTFDTVQYGELELGRAEFERCHELARRLVHGGSP
jgi:hypothetical protein